MMDKPRPRSRPWLVEILVKGKWWTCDQFGIEEKAIRRMKSIRDSAAADFIEDVRVRFEQFKHPFERIKEKC